MGTRKKKKSVEEEAKEHLETPLPQEPAWNEKVVKDDVVVVPVHVAVAAESLSGHFGLDVVPEQESGGVWHLLVKDHVIGKPLISTWKGINVVYA